MSIRLGVFSAALAALLAFPVGASALGDGDGKRERKGGGKGAKLDKNGDGVITKDELPDGSRLAARFAEIDKDGDGSLTREELKAGRKDRKGKGGKGKGDRRRGSSVAPI